MPTGASHGGTDLSRCGDPRHRPGDGARQRRRVPRRGRGESRRRVQGDGRALRAVRPAARARHADLRAGDPRRRDGRGDDRAQADRRDHVLGLLRGVLRLHRQRVPEEPLHDQRADQVPAGGAHRQRRGLALRRAAHPERRELVHDDPRAQGRGAVEPGRRDRPARRLGARSRPGDLPRAQVALCDQGRGAGRRDPRQARHREDPAARQGRDHPGAWR